MRLVMMTTLGVFTAIQFQFIVLNILVCTNMIRSATKFCWKMITGQIIQCLLFNICQPTLCWVFITTKLDASLEKQICAILLFASGYIFKDQYK